MENYVSFIIIHSFITYSIVSGDNALECATDNIFCEAHSDNLLDSVGGVINIEECRQLCQDTKTCEYLTYYSRDSFPLQEMCFLFTSCNTTNTCSHCSSESRDCYYVCGGSRVGAIDNNHLETVADVESEVHCKDLCHRNGF